MVSRLDGPDPTMVRRVMRDAIATEEKGLTGVAYFDARWKAGMEHKNRREGYRRYDRALHNAADVVKRGGRLLFRDR
jgi:hypothetical protein